MVNMRMTISTKGVKGAPLVLQEFTQGIVPELAKVLPEFADNVMDQMQINAPYRTGWLRNNIRYYSPSPFAISVMSWAGYSGYVNYGTFRMMARPFFTQEVEGGPAVLAPMLAHQSMNFLHRVIMKHQSKP